MKKAKKSDWKTISMPKQRSELNITIQLSAIELDRIKHGIVPQQMEDKWFIYFEDHILYFHRSWSGACIYSINLLEQPDSLNLSKATVNRDSTQYKYETDEFDSQVLSYLINRILLAKPVDFPHENIHYKHNIVGYARANSE